MFQEVNKNKQERNRLLNLVMMIENHHHHHHGIKKKKVSQSISFHVHWNIHKNVFIGFFFWIIFHSLKMQQRKQIHGCIRLLRFVSLVIMSHSKHLQNELPSLLACLTGWLVAFAIAFAFDMYQEISLLKKVLERIIFLYTQGRNQIQLCELLHMVCR